MINYVTSLGEVFGRLFVTESEIIFDPLNPQLKGFVDQKEKKVQESQMMSFSIDYKDILGQIKSEVIEGNHFVTIDLVHTGYQYYQSYRGE